MIRSFCKYRFFFGLLTMGSCIFGLLIFGLFIFGTGCAHRSECSKVKIANAKDFLGKFATETKTVTSLRAEARVEQRGRQGRIKGTVWMLLKAPNQLRFDVMTQFGPAAVLTSDGERFALMDQREGKAFAGDPCPENIARLLGIALPGDGIIQILTGQVPVIRAENLSMQCTPEGRSRVTLQSPEGWQQYLDFDVQEKGNNIFTSTLVHSEVIQPNGKKDWSVRFSNFKKMKSENQVYNLPQKIVFTDHKRKNEVTIRFKSIEVEVEIPEEAFRQEFSPARQPLEVQCSMDTEKLETGEK